MQKCLRRADDLPDIAAAEAGAWIKKGGGADAHLCRAFAQANRGMHADAAREFWGLASGFAKTDRARAVTTRDFAGQEFLRAKDTKNALAQYNAALKISPGDAGALVGRAEANSAQEKYWDALDDLNRALKIQPQNATALRQRGRVWMQLGDPKKAAEDFASAESLAPQTKTGAAAKNK